MTSPRVTYPVSLADQGDLTAMVDMVDIGGAISEKNEPQDTYIADPPDLQTQIAARAKTMRDIVEREEALKFQRLHLEQLKEDRRALRNQTMNPSTIDTRNQAFFQHRNSGKLGEQQKRIMRAIHESNARHGKHDHSLREICAMTGLPVNAVSGRVNELKNEPHCLLKESTPRKCRVTGNRVTPVIVA